MNEKLIIKPVSMKEIPDFVKLRRLMFEWMNYKDQLVLDNSDIVNTKYLSENLNKTFFGWIAKDSNGLTVGSVGLVIDQHPPSPTNLTGKIGYIMSLSIDPRFRKQGIATQLLKTVIEYLKNLKITVVSLHASEMGRSLYESFGFKTSNEMKLTLK
jgi:ribosomal protein S18 acetylase RimI-like enzyme